MSRRHATTREPIRVLKGKSLTLKQRKISARMASQKHLSQFIG